MCYSGQALDYLKEHIVANDAAYHGKKVVLMASSAQTEESEADWGFIRSSTGGFFTSALIDALNQAAGPGGTVSLDGMGTVFNTAAAATLENTKDDVTHEEAPVIKGQHAMFWSRPLAPGETCGCADCHSTGYTEGVMPAPPESPNATAGDSAYINDSGTIVMNLDQPGGLTFAWTVTNGVTAPVVPYDAKLNLFATGITNQNYVVGYTKFFEAHIFNRTQGFNLPPLSGGTSDIVNGLNSSGVAVGSSNDATGQYNLPVMWRHVPGGPITFPLQLPLLPGGSSGFATGINSGGQIIGRCETGKKTSQGGAIFHAVEWNPDGSGNYGAPTDLDALEGDISSAVSINAGGGIVGTVVTAAGEQHAFVYQNGKMTNLVVPSVAAGSFATAINNSGVIVGGYFKQDLTSKALIWSGGTATDLNTFLPANSGLTLDFATGLNNNGDIMVQGTQGGKKVYIHLAPTSQ
jgi:probable HAF family extracellular repeat protein